ncbi:alkene reductase [Paenibacillus barcinonensis]|uniref:Alkene reductase n=1 Tax=Paenibacillus barcinonensis TaxID=198119 RepID=A0A2V4V6D3_PAEBA|nr:alkene reductase [Paenibacillus barcinonensis]PYE48027.1 N-ethylmaleimide reductase [Paenibacillus barcinonensis]QKS55144.1 alkene reductase [Paenibacillus barcinonensis]
MSNSALTIFRPASINQWNLRNRIVMAPLTRGFARDGDGTVTDEIVAYYEQRAKYGAGLIITEGITPMLSGKGTYGVPGLYTEAQTASWAKVTEAVHRHGGTIIAQLWHVGRLSHSDLIGGKPQAPSAIQAEGRVHKLHKPYEIPQAMTIREIEDVVAHFQMAARNAVLAGFDGVEIHAAHGYLIDQFISERTNKRVDEYGGGMRGRLRFLKEIIMAVQKEISADRICIRFSEKKDDDPYYEWALKVETLHAYLELFRETGITILHPSTENYAKAWSDRLNFHQAVRAQWEHIVIGVGDLDLKTADKAINDGVIDLAAFGRPFIANPDLVQRWQSGLPITPYNQNRHLSILR